MSIRVKLSGDSADSARSFTPSDEGDTAPKGISPNLTTAAKIFSKILCGLMEVFSKKT
jgi:hypothetical protein